eukprot:10556176-Alexandrium_andersonii.AAC.1
MPPPRRPDGEGEDHGAQEKDVAIPGSRVPWAKPCRLRAGAERRMAGNAESGARGWNAPVPDPVTPHQKQQPLAHARALDVPQRREGY